MTTLIAFVAMSGVGAPQPFSFQGWFFEGCSCKNACTFELKGKIPGCSAAGFYAFNDGKYAGQSLAETRVAFVAGKDWIRLYYDGPSVEKREAAKKFISAALKDWGKPEVVESRAISVARTTGKYLGAIENGKILSLTVLGTSNATVHRNIFNRLLHPDIMQAQTQSCKFQSGKRKLDFKNSNGFFHPALKVSGKV